MIEARRDELLPAGPTGSAWDTPEVVESGVADDRERMRIGVDAMPLVGFLSVENGVPVGAIHEYDLREFLFDYYPAQRWYPSPPWVGDFTSRALLASLRRFFRFLERERGISCPWAEGILGDDVRFEGWTDLLSGALRMAAEKGQVPEMIQLLAGAHIFEFRQSGFTPRPETGAGVTWEAPPDSPVASLYAELQDRWLVWKERLIEEGVAAPEELRRRPEERQDEWETTPHPDFGSTPEEVVREARVAPPSSTDEDEREDFSWNA